MPTVYIALGSNLGDRQAHIEFAKNELTNLTDSQLTGFSSIHETEPVGPLGQRAYLNAAAALDTHLSPNTLLTYLRRIEQATGRVRREKWGARTLDLDILLYDDQIITTDELTIPHPHMHQRIFVLDPLSEIAPNVIHPSLHQTIASLLVTL